MKFKIGCIVAIAGHIGLGGFAQATDFYSMEELAQEGGCAMLDRESNLSVPYISVEESSFYSLNLKTADIRENSGNDYWTYVDSNQISEGAELILATTDSSLNINLPCVYVADGVNLYKAQLLQTFDPIEPFSSTQYWETDYESVAIVPVCDLAPTYCITQEICEHYGSFWYNATCHSEEIPVVTSETGKVWMDRNLGASQVATSYSDNNAFGDLYQWGREADGHEKRTSETTSDISYTSTPSHNKFIVSKNDWQFPQNHNLWQGTTGENNPCPSGFRLPTGPEWTTERASWGVSFPDTGDAYNAPIKLVAAGYRDRDEGDLKYIANVGRYSSSTVFDIYSVIMSVETSNAGGLYKYNRADGYSVRCIMD